MDRDENAILRLRAAIDALAEHGLAPEEIACRAQDAHEELRVLEARMKANAGDARPRDRAKRLVDLCVLVVEDEADSRELIELLLASEGARVRTAGTADEALAMFDELAPDVVLSDIGMPGRDGYWLAGEVRARRPNIAAIALTAYSAKADVERAIAAGFDHHVGKPVDPEQLIRALASARRRAA